jgi:3-hydroxypropionyl-coenzyme A dehydratase
LGVERSLKGGALWISMNRPEKLNAINSNLLEELTNAVNEANELQEVKVVVLQGNGGNFSAGADLQEIASLSPERALDFSRKGISLMQRIRSSEKPFIAIIQGYALGGGLELALACDLRIASENAIMGFPEVNYGMFPGFGGISMMIEFLNRAKAGELLLTGNTISAREAESLGLVNKVFPDNEIAEEAQREVESISSKSSSALKIIKKLLGSKYEPWSNAESESSLWASVSCSDEVKGRILSFLNRKRN